jgi:hypothetical protein
MALQKATTAMDQALKYEKQQKHVHSLEQYWWFPSYVCTIQLEPAAVIFSFQPSEIAS